MQCLKENVKITMRKYISSLHYNLCLNPCFSTTLSNLCLFLVLGAWNVEWQYEYDKLLLPPSVLQEGERWVLIIQPKVDFIIPSVRITYCIAGCEEGDL